LWRYRRGVPPLFFVSAHSKGLVGAFSASAHCKGLRGADKARASSQSRVESRRLGPGILVCAEKFSSWIFIAQLLKIRKTVAWMTRITLHVTTRHVERLGVLRIFFIKEKKAFEKIGPAGVRWLGLLPGSYFWKERIPPSSPFDCARGRRAKRGGTRTGCVTGPIWQSWLASRSAPLHFSTPAARTS
jgi:hypothetical protein